MKGSSNIYKNGEKLFGPGFIWFVTSVILVILPTFCSYLFKCISEEKILGITDYFTDILLLLFSISCNLFTLCINKDKLINKTIKKIGMIVSVILFVISGLYYFYLDGMKRHPNNAIICIISLFCISCCSIIGWIIEYKNEKYLLQENRKEGEENSE